MNARDFLLHEYPWILKASRSASTEYRDLAQETAIEVCRIGDQSKLEDNPKAYVFRIIRRHAMRLFCKESKHVRLAERTRAEPPIGTVSPEDLVGVVEREKLCRWALEGLPSNLRDVIYWWQAGLSCEATAEKLMKPISTIKRWRQEARRLLLPAIGAESNTELAELARRGNQCAYAILVRVYETRVFGVALLLLGQEMMAMTVTKRAFRLSINEQSRSNDCPYQVVLFGCLISGCRRVLQNKPVTLCCHASALAIPHSSQIELHRALQCLTRLQREVVVLSVHAGLQPPDIARILEPGDLGDQQVSTHLYQALAALSERQFNREMSLSAALEAT